MEITLKSEQQLIEEKTKQLERVRDGTLSPKELADLIAQRRLSWLKSNRGLLRHDLPLPEAAFRLLVYDNMSAEDGISMAMESERLLRIESRNPCPYLEACKALGMDTRYVCKEILEPSIVAFMKKIDPRLHFSRDYDKIRPYHDCCMEFVEVRK